MFPVAKHESYVGTAVRLFREDFEQIHALMSEKSECVYIHDTESIYVSLEEAREQRGNRIKKLCMVSLDPKTVFFVLPGSACCGFDTVDHTLFLQIREQIRVLGYFEVFLLI